MGAFAGGLTNGFCGTFGTNSDAGNGGAPLPRAAGICLVPAEAAGTATCFVSVAAFISATASRSIDPNDFTSHAASTLQFGGVNSFFERRQSASIVWHPSQ